MGTIDLKPYTLERCHQFWNEYVADPDMMDRDFSYDSNWVERYYTGKCQKEDRKYFAICLNETVIGEIQLKSIDKEQKSAVLSVHLSCNQYKNQGYGTEAIRQMVSYGFDELHLNKIYADCLHRNHRSRHVLEKLNFRYLRSDETFHYFILEK